MGLFDGIGKKKKQQKRDGLLHPDDLAKLKGGLAVRQIVRTFDKPVEPAAEPTPAETVEAEQDAAAYPSAAWRLIEALHAGSSEEARSIVDEVGSEDAERLLLDGILAAWNAEAKQAELLLLSAVKNLGLSKKGMAYLELARLYVDMDRADAARRHLSSARRYSYEDSDEERRLDCAVKLLDSRADLELGFLDKAKLTIDSLLNECRDEYAKASALYLLGCIAPYSGGEHAAAEENLRSAAAVFEQRGDRYCLALARLELSRGLEDKSLASGLARKAAQELEALGRKREARYARARACEIEAQSAEPQSSAETIFGYDRVGDCLFISPIMRAIRLKLDAVAGADCDPVLILGPRGSGKEMIAQAIHKLGPRRGEKMSAINCGAIPEQLFESELFGYEKGAFTGASAQKKGLFETAGKGILFLDEIGELTPATQAKLLRVIQFGKFKRLGGEEEIEAQARVIAATNRNIDEAAKTGAFREDLLDRLSVWRVETPPLSRRREEILPLAEEFLRRYGGEDLVLDSSAKKYLLEKEHSGNVRTVESDVRRGIGNARSAKKSLVTASMLCDEKASFENLIPEPFGKAGWEEANGEGAAVPLEKVPRLDEAILELERRALTTALAAANWNKTLARTQLGLSETTFWRAMKRHGLQ